MLVIQQLLDPKYGMIREGLVKNCKFLKIILKNLKKFRLFLSNWKMKNHIYVGFLILRTMKMTRIFS